MITKIIISLSLIYATWIFYVLVMGFYRARLSGRLKGLTLIMAAPFILVGVLLDVVLQVTLATLVFRDLPRHWLLTSRLQEYSAGHGWRKRWADAICTRLLDPFDPTGDHC